jgi:hypothetical protein
MQRFTGLRTRYGFFEGVTGVVTIDQAGRRYAQLDFRFSPNPPPLAEFYPPAGPRFYFWLAWLRCREFYAWHLDRRAFYRPEKNPT